MSPQRVEVVRNLFAALEENDLATVLGLFDSDVEWSPTEGTYHGIEGVGAHFIEWMEPWDEHSIDLEESFESGVDQVFVTIHLTARGEHSGMQIDQRFFQLYTVKQGKIARMAEYVDRASALQAAGFTSAP